MNQGMEFEGSCPQDAVGLVVLKGISLSASTRENQSSFVLSLTSKSSELGFTRKLTNNGELMEFEGSCPQDTVGLVILKGLSLSASTRENHSSFGLSFTSKPSIGTWMETKAK
ncbi:hypothetical protein NC651_027916 [Populus alba x Populus x berolinensis]|nr:hypothetical protein NC651_027916 [Populus alba x Populus x berolinensis]